MEESQDLLLSLIRNYLDGGDRSLQLANAIEALIVERYADAPWFEDVTTALALYNPVGGPEYYHEGDLADALARVRLALVPPRSN